VLPSCVDSQGSRPFPSQVFTVGKKSDAGDATVFVSKDGEARLLVGALKTQRLKPPKIMRSTSPANYNVTYRRGGDSWYVLSGEGKGKTFYEKVMFSCGGKLINSFAMLYPTEQSKTFDPIIERIEDSFRSGPQCAPRSAARTLLAPKRNSRRPRRAPKADQWWRTPRVHGRTLPIARAGAGRDVMVILRRNGPPYDRKVLRGYVSQ
jgi:hypothetical protein